jgi:hypothetical protein
MNSIGGYFELELSKGKEFHSNAIRLNTGRNALQIILIVKKFKSVYLPYYTCDVILEPFKKTNIPYKFYNIDKNFEPIFDYSTIKEDEGFLYTNYFGLKDNFISSLIENCKNLIIDNSQSFFSLPPKGIPTFYSCRKFFGVPDGAYLYLDEAPILDLPLDHSETRFAHLLKRIEYGPEAGYSDFKANDSSLSGQPIKKMSELTKALLSNIDYEFVRNKRKENFLFFQEELSEYNEFEINICKESIPMIYPFLTHKIGLREWLIKNKVFVAIYWPNVIKLISSDTIEYMYATNFIHLPIDQRYTKEQIKNIIALLMENQ